MIQRIQSLYLLLVFIIGLFLLFVDPTIASGMLNNIAIKVGYIHDSSNILVLKTLNLILLIALSGGTISVIFLYKNLALQKRMVNYLVVLCLVYMGILGWDYLRMRNQIVGQAFYPGVHLIWILAQLTFLILSSFYIRKDIKLLKSMDRIR